MTVNSKLQFSNYMQIFVVSWKIRTYGEDLEYENNLKYDDDLQYEYDLKYDDDLK